MMPSTSDAPSLHATVLAFANERIDFVAKGIETPRLAAFVVWQLAVGVAAASHVLQGDIEAARTVRAYGEALAIHIDPDFLAHRMIRYGTRPADLLLDPDGAAALRLDPYHPVAPESASAG